MSFLLSNFYLLVIFFIDFSWTQGLDKFDITSITSNIYKAWWFDLFNGTATNCDDSEIEKYIIPGQAWVDSSTDFWKENAKMTVT